MEGRPHRPWLTPLVAPLPWMEGQLWPGPQGPPPAAAYTSPLLTCHVLWPCRVAAWTRCPVRSTQACDLSRGVCSASPSAALCSPTPGLTPNQSKAGPEPRADTCRAVAQTSSSLGPQGWGPLGYGGPAAQHSIIHSFGKSALSIRGVPRGTLNVGGLRGRR